MADGGGKIKESLTWLRLAAQFLGLLERLLPAFLVAWNAELARRNAELRTRLAEARMRARIRGKKDAELAKSDGKSDQQIIDDMLGGDANPSPGDGGGDGARVQPERVP